MIVFLVVRIIEKIITCDNNTSDNTTPNNDTGDNRHKGIHNAACF